ncbi:hypothetical protein AMK32_29010 [Streptomyces sp. CB01883]|nr:hypothetical protein AMK32_29010 [Streptomyces sp. CB01883]
MILRRLHAGSGVRARRAVTAQESLQPPVGSHPTVYSDVDTLAEAGSPEPHRKCARRGWPHSAPAIRLHGSLLRAAIDGDAEKAADLASGHMERFEAAIRSVIRRGTPPAAQSDRLHGPPRP